MTRPDVRYVKHGEMLAMDPSVLRRGDVGAFFWLFGDPPKPNERVGDVTIVSIRGELEHHDSGWGCESYEGIKAKLEEAVSGEDCRAAHELAQRQARYDDPEWDESKAVPFEASPPKTIIACIDSPGGVVAGLNETVRWIRKLVKAHPEIEWCCYVNEMAASAAYALACAFGEIICPPDSAVLGSIGVISTMISQAKKNEKDGYDVVLLTSGQRKADGHVHAPISERAKQVEMDRVNTLAGAFFALASKARGISVAAIEALQAGIFLSKEAKRRGLADAIMSWDDVLLGSGGKEKETDGTLSGGNQTDRRVGVKTLAQGGTTSEAPMSVELKALVKKTEAKIAAEKDPEKLAKLYADLSAYKKTEKHIEHHKTEEDDDDDGDEDDEKGEGDDEEKKSAKKSEEEEAKKSEEEKKASKKDDEEDEEEEAKAALALVRSLTGMSGEKARGAIQALASLAANTAKDVAELKKAKATTEKAALIATAKGRFITGKEAEFLSGQSMSTVTGFIEMRRKAGGIVVTDEGDLVKPEHAAQPGTEQSLPKETQAMINDAVEAWQGDKEKYRAALVKSHLEAHKKSAMNGGVH